MSKCPKCGGTDIAVILWGLPHFDENLKQEIKNKKTVLGGCCITGNDPKLECNDCKWRYDEK